MKYFLFGCGLLLLLSFFNFRNAHSPLVVAASGETNSVIAAPSFDEKARLHAFATEAAAFAKQENFCGKYCFLVDMRMSSNRKRFFIYDMPNDSIMGAGMVAHGSGSETASEGLIFSNKEGSYATSLGKYRVGEEYNGRFGLAFKLLGLEPANSNAFARAVVLHGHPLIPANETTELICTSWGCPTVSPDFLPLLKSYIDKAGKPVLLWIFY